MPQKITYTVEKFTRPVGSSHVLQQEVARFTFSDGEVWDTVTLWENKPRAGWRTVNMKVVQHTPDGEKYRQYRALQNLLNSTTEAPKG